MHGDLCFDNVVSEGERLTILDFADAGVGNACHDPAYLFVQLQLLKAKPFQPPSEVEALERALQEGLRDALRPPALRGNVAAAPGVCWWVDLQADTRGGLRRWYARWLWRQQEASLRAL